MFILIGLAVWAGLVMQQGPFPRWPCPPGLNKGCSDAAQFRMCILDPASCLVIS